MRNKDAMLLENCYNKVKGTLVKEQYEDMEFTNTVDVQYIDSDSPEVKALDISVKNDAVGYDKKTDEVNVKFKIELEYRRYGIKGIMAYGFKLEPFQFVVMDEEFEEKVIKEFPETDLSEAKYSRTSNGTEFYPSSITLFVDKDLNIIPSKCEIDF
jgi:hypothetical protein